MKLQDASDEALLQACRRGDQDAWDVLVKRFERLVFTVPRRAGLDEDSAADVFQTVFTRLVGALDAIERPDRLRAWLVTTARRETWRQLARRVPTVTAHPDADEMDDEIERVPDPAPLADEQIERLETQHTVRQAVESLDDRCRELITMLFLTPEPPPYTEIAERLGVPLGAIGPNRARCLKKLLTRIKLPPE